MDEYYEISNDFFFDEEPMTPEEEAAERRSQEQEARDSMMGEMYAAQYSFDWELTNTERCAPPVDNSVDNLRSLLRNLQKIPRNFVKTHNKKGRVWIINVRPPC